jgi:hypothetical protein
MTIETGLSMYSAVKQGCHIFLGTTNLNEKIDQCPPKTKQQMAITYIKIAL